jgi:hypothetical protein
LVHGEVTVNGFGGGGVVDARIVGFRPVSQEGAREKSQREEDVFFHEDNGLTVFGLVEMNKLAA